LSQTTQPTAQLAATEATDTRGKRSRKALLQSLSSLIVDVGVPVAAYYLLTSAFGLSDLAALAWSGALPAVRTVWGLAKDRRINGMALLMLTTNVIGLLLSLVVGDPRVMIAKDSGVTSTVGIAFLCSALFGRPLLNAVVRPAATKGDPNRLVAWDRLTETSAPFQRAQRVNTSVWGIALLVECVLRVIGAFTLPLHVMVWLGPVLLVASMVLAMVISVRIAIVPMQRLMAAAINQA
jgi:hypothetical protein